MAFVVTDHVHTRSFTPREHQVELLYSALERNIIICLGKSPELTFIGTKLVQEFAIGNRKSLTKNGKRIIYLLKDEEACTSRARHIEQSTDLKVLGCWDIETFDLDRYNEGNVQVLLLTVKVCAQLLTNGFLNASQVKLLLIDKCHNLTKNLDLDVVLEAFRVSHNNINNDCDDPARIVGFAIPLYSLTKQPGKLSYEIQKIESSLRCQIETASDLLSILRYSPKPREFMLAYKITNVDELTQLLKNCTDHALDFLYDHRYDPHEVYKGNFSEEIEKIPNPTEKPCEVIHEFLYILNTLGPWAADRAALVILALVEKLKIKTPYDRHYLLLGTLTTLFIKIRAYCDSFFENLEETEKIFKFSSPKIHRLIEVIKVFAPPIKKDDDVVKKNIVDDKTIVDIKSNKKEEKNNVVTKINGRGQFKRSDPEYKRSKYYRQRGPTDPDLLCGLIFVDNMITAKVLFYLLNELSKKESEFRFLFPLYLNEKTNDDIISGRDIEMEHKKQEEVLKKFRIHECNLLISTSVLEEGIDIPKCNFVMRFDFPKNYQSYAQCKSRARANDAVHILLVSETRAENCIKELAHYHYIEQILLAKCSSKDASLAEEIEADAYDSFLPAFKPLSDNDAPRVTLNSAISLINRYCAKLPSDTFTRLTPEWKFYNATCNGDGKKLYACSLRLPINSPLKYSIESYPMPTKALAKRIAALLMCVQLHRENEIDDNLLPVSKENFRALPEDSEVPSSPDDENVTTLDARPGTTKRRQYYYKKIANALIDCKPELHRPCYLYHIKMMLSCPLPEEQNTRGRKIYPPEESDISFGILTHKKIPKICPFPIYTRSGEVRIELRLCKETVVLDDSQIEKALSFLNYTFTNVLRLQKYLMLFDPKVSENSYIIVPVKRSSNDIHQSEVCIDWGFIECIYQNRNATPTRLSVENRRNFVFDPTKYTDAVVMPWYRNQDQPQYFYVAEICNHLNPQSTFPGCDYKTFEDYYMRKYDLQIQNLEQPLLDVDHTSARLNFLTPRYVNRKGVALPTSSEETKRAKRENLEQKQILVAELCSVHPFPASLWRQAVCLPCILYRINALLLADQIRCEVARSINLGLENLSEEFEWPALDFGWRLAEVLKKSRENDKSKLENKENKIESSQIEKMTHEKSLVQRKSSFKEKEEEEEEEDEEKEYELEIGTWSNDLLQSIGNVEPLCDAIPSNSNWNNVRYGSPGFDLNYFEPDVNNDYDLSGGSCSDDDYDDFDYCESDNSDSSYRDEKNLTIAYNNDNEAEAFDKKGHYFEKDKKLGIEAQEKLNDFDWDNQEMIEDDPDHQLHKSIHEENVSKNEVKIISNGLFVAAENPVTFSRKNPNLKNQTEPDKLEHEDYVRLISSTFVSNLKTDKDRLSNKQNPAMVTDAENPKFQLKDNNFSFDHQPELEGHPGPSPSLILQALTMSNANDGINLERLETIGDSFLKYAITTYLFCAYNNIHEGKLSHLRSKQVSNLNLYRLGRRKFLGESMIATKFEPHDNWLPPCYKVPRELERALVESGIPPTMWSRSGFNYCLSNDQIEIEGLVRETELKLELLSVEHKQSEELRSSVPYNLITQHSIPDKSIADCVEALIGAYLIACGPRGALLFMSWLGIHVLPVQENKVYSKTEPIYRVSGSTPYVNSSNNNDDEEWTQLRYGKLEEPPSPLFCNVKKPEEEVELMLDGYDVLEASIGYKFTNRSYLLQAFTHASYQPNRLTDCYQRLEFLGDAVLDYLITRHLYEDPRQHSPGALTDLRSALVNNTIFASLAVRCGFHKYFRHLSPGLNSVIDRFVRIQEENGHSISEEYYLIGEEYDDASEEAEDVEVPKALGDVFESLAGAIYLDSGMSLDAVWSVYNKIMHAEIEQFSANVPKSPIRELLELEPETAKFGRPEKLADGKRVRVIVDVFDKGLFKGIGRNYRIAKCTAAKCALKKLKKSKKSG